MQFLRANWVAVVFLAAIALSFYVANQQSVARDQAQRVQLVAGCTRTSERSVLDAAYKQKTSAVRRAAGGAENIRAADEYQKFALGGVALIPLPEAIVKQMVEDQRDWGEALLSSVEDTTNASGQQIYHLTPAARKVVHQGCVEAYS